MQIPVALENGEIAACQVIKRTGFNHDIGARTCLVEYDGKQFMAVVQRGAWRKSTAVWPSSPTRLARAFKRGEWKIR